jgi:hypothetical protein
MRTFNAHINTREMSVIAQRAVLKRPFVTYCTSEWSTRVNARTGCGGKIYMNNQRPNNGCNRKRLINDNPLACTSVKERESTKLRYSFQ